MDVLPIGIMHHCDGKYDVESDVSSHNVYVWLAFPADTVRFLLTVA